MEGIKKGYFVTALIVDIYLRGAVSCRDYQIIP